MVIIVGGYILLRPILVRFGARLQEKQLEKEATTVSNEGAVKEKKQDKKDKENLQWGRAARIRQRRAVEGGNQLVEESDSDSEDLKEILE